MRDLDRIKEKVVIRLDNRQVALAIVGFIVVSIGTFAGGVVVGKQMADAVPESIAGEADDGSLDSLEEHRERALELTEVSPGTRSLHQELAGPPHQLTASSPTEAARIETHRQIAQARRGVTRSLGPVAVGPVAKLDGSARTPEPLNLVQRNPAAERKALEQGPDVPTTYALQVSAFSTPGPAQVVAQELSQSGHTVQVRQVQNEAGAALYRVEVGHFADAKKAEDFQRTFEKSSGYSTVMVPIR